MKVGFIGLGSMGSAIAGNLKRAGHDLIVYNRTRSRTEALAGQGVAFREAPQGLSWGYGAELEDPDGHVVCLWDEASMKKHMESSGQGR